MGFLLLGDFFWCIIEWGSGGPVSGAHVAWGLCGALVGFGSSVGACGMGCFGVALVWRALVIAWVWFCLAFGVGDL